MDNNFWTAKFDKTEGADVAEISVTGGPASPMALNAVDEHEHPKLIMPVVGDKMRFMVLPYGQIHLVNEDSHVAEGQNVIEVEVTAVKKARVSYE